MSEPDEVKEVMSMKVNDVFHFRYHPKQEHGWDPRTHCFQGTLTVCERKGGLLLVDTYWGIGRDGRTLTLDEAKAQGVLSYYFNLNNTVNTQEDSKLYYAEEDMFYIGEQSHCTKHYFLRKGAQRSKEKMLEVVNNKIREHNEKVKWLLWDIQRDSETKTKIELGNLEVFL